MARSSLAVLTGAVALCALGGLCAQNQSRGVLAGAATAVLVDGGTLGDAQTLAHPNGFAQQPPLTFGALPTAPNLRTIFAQYGAPTTIDVDDISTGLDDILLTSDGVLDVPPILWSVWSFSLTATAVGQPGSAIAVEAQTGDVGTALFSYVLPGSNLPAQFVDRTFRSHSRRDLGIATPNAEVDAVDFGIMFGLDQQLAQSGGTTATEPGFVPLIGAPLFLFFTVSHATRDFVPGAWWSGAPRSGANILYTTRTSPNAPWAQPSLFRSFVDLGLTQDEDIDALAIDWRTEQVLFSCVGNARDQFLYVDLTEGGAPQTVTLPSGNPLSGGIGKAQTDDVDAICTLDPDLTDVATMPPGGDLFGSSCGAPRPGLFGAPQMNGSAYRRYQGGQVRFDTFMVGWPDASGPAPALAACFVTSADNIDPILVGLHVRDPLDVIPGNPQSESVLVPPSAALSGDRFTLRWIQIDWPTGVVTEAWPVQIFL